MKFAWLLVVSPALAPMASSLQDRTPIEAPAADAYADAVKAYSAAMKKWREELRAAAKESKEKEAALRKEHPIAASWPKFEALAASDGRALVWMADNCDDRIDKREDVSAKKAELVAALIERHADADWAADELVRMLPRQRAWFDEAWVRARLEELAKRSKNVEVASSAWSALADRLSSSRSTPEEKARAAEIAKQIERDYPTSKAARQVLIEREASAYQIGGTPHDFAAVDVDGAAFKLTDYRGKVVMLDFWGFW